MYAVLSKKDETSWDIIHVIAEDHEPKVKLLLEDAFTNKSHLVGMETTSFRDNARLGSTWDGVSFSGGVTRPEDSVILDIWDEHKRFSFLSDSVIVTNFVISNQSIFSDFFSERFQGEVILVKVPEDQAVAAGENYGWDGLRFAKV
jgi:hypothetical protein